MKKNEVNYDTSDVCHTFFKLNNSWRLGYVLRIGQHDLSKYTLSQHNDMNQHHIKYEVQIVPLKQFRAVRLQTSSLYHWTRYYAQEHPIFDQPQGGRDPHMAYHTKLVTCMTSDFQQKMRCRVVRGRSPPTTDINHIRTPPHLLVLHPSFAWKSSVTMRPEHTIQTKNELRHHKRLEQTVREHDGRRHWAP